MTLDDWSNFIYSRHMNTKTNQTRQHILDIGYELIIAKGFSNVGLSELLKQAQVPKGSFYHYFKSKEQFGEALIQEYFVEYESRLSALFNVSNGNGLECLMSYWSMWFTCPSQSISGAKGTSSTDQITHCGADRCLIVKLSAEVSGLSEPMRIALLKGATMINVKIAECIQRGIDDQSIHVTDAQRTAENLYYLWIGAALMGKLDAMNHRLPRLLEDTRAILKGK